VVHNQRKKHFVDREVQGALSRRVALYLWLVVVLIALLSTIWIFLLDGPLSGRQLVERSWTRFGPAWIAALLSIPVVVFDCIRFSNRFAGPMVRLRRSMRELAAGKEVKPIRFRNGDFWCDFADDFNEMLLERQRAEKRVEVKETPSNRTYSTRPGLGIIDRIEEIHVPN